MKAIAAIALVALVGASLASAASNCEGAGYDLTSLAGADMPGTDSAYSYVLQVCGTTTESVCKGNGGAFCQYGKAAPNTYQHVMTKWDGSGAWSTCTDATKCPNGGFQVYYANGDGCGGTTGAPRAVTYYFACPAAGQTSSINYQITAGAAQCQYNVIFQHNVGCEGGGGSSGGGSKGLSGGSVFLIILVVIIPVYIAIGCIYKRQKMGTSGMESCPNIDFWRDLPSLVSDGFKFTYRKTCGRGGADAPYENVK